MRNFRNGEKRLRTRKWTQPARNGSLRVTPPLAGVIIAG
jgi:hypothetical protein